MPKFDFNNSLYARFFADKSNQNFLQTFINTEGVLAANYGWYKTQGRKASAATPVDASGVATFTVKARAVEAAPMMDLRAPLGDTNQMDSNGIDFYTGTIPNFSAPGWTETAMEREQRERMFEIFGNDADLVAEWVSRLQFQIDAKDTTLNNITAQIMSTGAIDYSSIGRGLRMKLHKADIPTENFVKAGTKVWTAADCAILSQMKEIETAYRDKRSYTGALVWQMPRKMYYDVFLKNKEVKELVKNFRTLNYIASTDEMPISDSQFKAAFVDYEGVSPIEVVTEKQRNLTHSKDVFIHGWKENVAVLRPAGDAVEFEYTDNLDRKLFEKYGASTISKTFAITDDGLGTIVNTTTNNGMYKEWHTDLFMSAIPALIHFPDHLIVDTTTAG